MTSPWFLSPVFALGTSFLFGVGLFLLFHLKRFQRTFVAFWSLWLALLVPYLGIGRIWIGPVPLLSGVFVYFAFSYFLGQIYFQVERGLSMRLLIEIENVPQHRMSQKELEQAYPYSTILSSRLTPSVQTGFFTCDGGRYSLTQKGKRSARLFRFLKWYLRLDPMA